MEEKNQYTHSKVWHFVNRKRASWQKLSIFSVKFWGLKSNSSSWERIFHFNFKLVEILRNTMNLISTRKYLLRGYPRCAKAYNCLGTTLGKWCNTGVNLKFTSKVEFLGSISYHLHNYFNIFVIPSLRWQCSGPFHLSLEF